MVGELRSRRRLGGDARHTADHRRLGGASPRPRDALRRAPFRGGRAPAAESAAVACRASACCSSERRVRRERRRARRARRRRAARPWRRRRAPSARREWPWRARCLRPSAEHHHSRARRNGSTRRARRVGEGAETLASRRRLRCQLPGVTFGAAPRRFTGRCERSSRSPRLRRPGSAALRASQFGVETPRGQTP